MTQMTQAPRAALPLAQHDGPPKVANPAMFFRRWLANPLQMGSIIPSSSALCERIVRHTTRAHDEVVLELGAGTGVVSRALLDSGMPPDRLIVVEIVPDMADHLRDVLPGAIVIEGDARALPDLLPRRWHGRIGTVICGIPLVLLPVPEQRGLIICPEIISVSSRRCGAERIRVWPRRFSRVVLESTGESLDYCANHFLGRRVRRPWNVP